MADAALDAFMETAQRIVYCSLATVDRRGRPRSRLVHAVWERAGDRIVGWVGSRPTGEDFVALRLDPWRVQAKSAAAMAAGEPYLVWTAT